MSNPSAQANTFLHDDNDDLWIEKEKLAQHFAPRLRIKGYLQVKSWCRVMGLPTNDIGLRTAFRIAHSLAAAGLGTFWPEGLDGRPPCFQFKEGVDVQAFGEAVLSALGSSWVPAILVGINAKGPADIQ